MIKRAADERSQRALERLYARLGSRIVYAVYAAGIAIGLVVGLVSISWVTRYLALPTGKAAAIAALLVLGGAPGAAIILWAWRDMFRTALSWEGENRTAERAPAVWESLVHLPYAVCRRALIPSCLLMIPYTALTFAVGIDHSWYSAVPFYAAAIAAVLATGVIWLFGGEFALRPMVRDVAAYLPDDFEPTAQAWRLRTKSLAPLPVVTLFAALTTGAFVDLVPPGALRLVLALGIALLTVAVAGGVFLIVTRATLDPIEDLLIATRRVGSGDITTPVPIVTADDFGRLAHSFNEMLAELRRHQGELRATQARIVTAADAARRGVERDLHDGAQQRLVLLHLKLGMAGRLVTRDPVAVERLVREMREDLTQAMTELRDLARGLYPVLLETDGLPGALAEAVGRSPIPTTLECDGLRRFSPDLEAAVYFCCLEALQNAAKHAGEGASATIRLSEREGSLGLEISDDGHGFDGTHARQSTGLLSMTDRIVALGGDLQITSAPGIGTTVTGMLPVSGGDR